MNYLANIEGGDIVIRIPMGALSTAVPIALERAWGEHRLFVEDEAGFAKEFVLALNAENEIGDTPIHLMLDKVAVEAIGNGAFGIGEEIAPIEADRPRRETGSVAQATKAGSSSKNKHQAD